MAYRESSYAKDTFDKYIFAKNLQGDVIAIYNYGGTCVASYTYNAWGECTVTNHTTANIGNINPFRYRGYYYDTETGFYYLNARYYDPQIKRFISADDVSAAGINSDFSTFNLYAYCGDNPINRVDESGMLWKKIKQAAKVAVKKVYNSVKKVKKSVDKALDPIGEFVEDLTELKDLEVVTDGENVTIKNSYKIDSSIVRFGYSFYLNHINEDTKDIIKGSTAGVAFEYTVHNKAYKFGKTFKIESFVNSGADLTIGRTIFADGDGNVTNSRNRFSKIMTGLYAGFAGPIFVAYDLYVQYGG